jgi:CheY-like chemotaxis protein
MPMRLMLVDDDENDLLFTRLALQRSGVDYEVFAFERAEEALTLLRNDPAHGIDIILLDINMPGLDGFGFLAAFEALPALRNVAVVMLTSSSDPSDQQRASLHRSVRGFLIKPLSRVDAASLTELIRKQ